jgi:adenine-specific DNA-methyltransferase
VSGRRAGCPSDLKLRGGYYMPLDIARFLADWEIRSSGDRVPEPSAGDG